MPRQRIWTLVGLGSAIVTLMLLASGLTGTSYEDASVQPGTLYFYTATATVGATTSADSAVTVGMLGQASNWASRDITNLGEAGSVRESDGVFLVKGSGSDVWGTNDEFRFVYKNLPGNGTITTKVESIQKTNDWAKSGIMIRETLARNSKYAFAFVTPAHGYGRKRRKRGRYGWIDRSLLVASLPQRQFHHRVSVGGWVDLDDSGKHHDFHGHQRMGGDGRMQCE